MEALLGTTGNLWNAVATNVTMGCAAMLQNMEILATNAMTCIVHIRRWLNGKKESEACTTSLPQSRLRRDSSLKEGALAGEHKRFAISEKGALRHSRGGGNGFCGLHTISSHPASPTVCCLVAGFRAWQLVIIQLGRDKQLLPLLLSVPPDSGRRTSPSQM